MDGAARGPRTSARLEGLTEPGTLRFSAMASQRKAAGERMISLGLGEPAFATPAHIIDATADAMRRGYTRYSPAPGLPDLRAAIAEKLKRENGLDYTADEILVTPGAKNALHLALTGLLSAGDEVVNILPCYPSYEPLVALAGPGVAVKRVTLTEDRYALPLDEIERALTPKTRVLLYNSPHNPAGRAFPENEVRALAALLAGRDTWLISDEIYEALSWGGVAHFSPAAIPAMRERTIVVSGFSKTYSMTGWRIGYLAAPRALAAALGRFHAQINTNTCTFVQHGALAALRGPRDHLDAFNRDVRSNAEYLVNALRDVPLVRLPPPDGGMFALVDIRATRLASEEFSVRLLERTGVATTPGVVFGAEGYVRISLANLVEETRLGVDLFAAFVREIAGS